MGLPPWETSDSQLFALITGANSGLGFAIAARMVDEFLSGPSTPPNKHLVLVLCTRTPLKTRFTISRLRAHLRKLADYSEFAADERKKAEAQGHEYKWEDMVQRVHFLGVEVDLCDLKSVYALADRLVNGTVGSPDATTMDGFKLPHGSPGTAAFSKDIKQDRWALSQASGSDGAQRSWGWGLSGIRLPRLDAIILAAGMGGWTGVDWFRAIKDVLSGPIEATTWPKFKLANVGAVIGLQSSQKSNTATNEVKQPLLDEQEKPDEPPLGEVFCSNFFGHYILAHELMPLLSRPATPSAKTGGKIVWVSSVEALEDAFSTVDIQGLKSLEPYESTKRLMDLVSISSDLPATQRINASFFNSSKTVSASKSTTRDSESNLVRPKMHLTHPGIFASDILPLHFVLFVLWQLLLTCVRWMGSIWHLAKPYNAAVAPVWITLTDSEELERIEDHGAKKCKWGSANNPTGADMVLKTEVPGWGFNGQPGTAEDKKKKGRKASTADATKESIEDFEVLGAECWTAMEKLRTEWEEILGVRQ